MNGEILVNGRLFRVSAPVRMDPGITFPGLGRRTETRAVVLHWTGGEGDPGGQLYRTLRSRRLSVQFAIAQDGMIWQYVDAQACAMQCAGANPWSVGIEIVNAATLLGSRKWPREVGHETVHGHTFRCNKFYPAQLVSAEVLTRALCSAYGLPYAAPPHANVLPAKELAMFRGVLGHLHVNPEKRDPGNSIFQNLGLQPTS